MAQVHTIIQDREVFHATPRETVTQVARRMAERNVGAILVTEEGNLRGIFSERDLMRRVVLGGRDPATTPVAEVMSTDVVTIDDHATLEDAMARMHDHACRHLPVLRGGQLVGFLSMRDLMDYELARKTEELQHMRAYIHGAG